MNPILNSPIQFVHSIQSRSPTQVKMLFCLIFLVSLSTVGSAPVWSIPGTEKIGQVGNHCVVRLLFSRMYQSWKKFLTTNRVASDCAVCQLTYQSSLSCESVMSHEFVLRVRHVVSRCESATWVRNVTASHECAPRLATQPATLFATQPVTRFGVLGRHAMITR